MRKIFGILIGTIFLLSFGLCTEAAVWKEFPVKVYIEYNVKKPLVKKAFFGWQSLTKIPQFEYVANEADADITVKFVRTTISNNNGTHTAGYTRWKEKNGYMQKAEITILSVVPGTNRLISDKDAYIFSLHEIGHALGLQHTKNPRDVMYYLYSTQPVITVNDLNALRSLYGK